MTERNTEGIFPTGLSKNTGNKGMNKNELKKKLTPEQYRVTQEKGTEAPFSGKFVHHKEKGMYSCVVCGKPLFPSDTKFDSGTGWPSFDKAIPEAVTFKEDEDMGMRRTEITCTDCGAHLGHVFPDGSTETGKRYCVNSVCLGFEKENTLTAAFASLYPSKVKPRSGCEL